MKKKLTIKQKESIRSNINLIKKDSTNTKAISKLEIAFLKNPLGTATVAMEEDFIMSDYSELINNIFEQKYSYLKDIESLHGKNDLENFKDFLYMYIKKKSNIFISI